METDCGQLHLSIEDAIAHARRNLGGMDIQPYWGTMTANEHLVVGYQITSRRRWRLDFDPNPHKLIHVNEENFDRPLSQQKVVHRVQPASFSPSGTPLGNDTQVKLYWKKWTSRYGTRR